MDDEGMLSMSDEEILAEEAKLTEDASEAQEAEGVADLEMGGAVAAEEVEALDAKTWDELDDEERAELEAAAAELEATAGPGDVEGRKSTRLSENFVLAEFHCCRGHCAGAHVPGPAVPHLRRLVTQVLQPMRNKFGAATVTSGYRNAAHNGHVGGESNSRHRHDRFPRQPAADVTFASGTVDQWAAEARRRLGRSEGGIGRYPSQRFVHVDLGPARPWTG